LWGKCGKGFVGGFVRLVKLVKLVKLVTLVRLVKLVTLVRLVKLVTLVRLVKLVTFQMLDWLGWLIGTPLFGDQVPLNRREVLYPRYSRKKPLERYSGGRSLILP
jgi:hypothetical protein